MNINALWIPDPSRPTFRWEATRFVECVALQWAADLERDWDDVKDQWISFTTCLAKSIAGPNRPNLDIPGKILVDFPSTGGVGNKIPLIAPFIALARRPDLAIPKISTRGETGGTIDILEALGVRTGLKIKEIENLLKQDRIVFAVPGEELAPLDDALMKVRRQTGTMRCTPLVVASILGKKLMVGCKYLVIDVKFGPDAKFRHIKDLKRACELFQEVWSRLVPKGGIGLIVSNNYVPQGQCFGRLLSLWEVAKTLKEGDSSCRSRQRLRQIANESVDRLLNLSRTRLKTLPLGKRAGRGPRSRASFSLGSGTFETGSNMTVPESVDEQSAYNLFKGSLKGQGGKLVEDLGCGEDPWGFFEKYKKEYKKSIYRVEAISLVGGKVCFIDMDCLDRCLKKLGRRDEGCDADVAGIWLCKDVDDQVYPGETVAWVYATRYSVAEGVARTLAREVFRIHDHKDGCAERLEYVRRREIFPDLSEKDANEIIGQFTSAIFSFNQAHADS